MIMAIFSGVDCSADIYENKILIGQQKIEEKSNEITAISIFREQLDIRRGGQYVIAIKKNQHNFHNKVVGLFEKVSKEEF